MLHSYLVLLLNVGFRPHLKYSLFESYQFPYNQEYGYLLAKQHQYLHKLNHSHFQEHFEKQFLLLDEELLDL